jgi:hypothetical protein
MIRRDIERKTEKGKKQTKVVVNSEDEKLNSRIATAETRERKGCTSRKKIIKATEKGMIAGSRMLVVKTIQYHKLMRADVVCVLSRGFGDTSEAANIIFIQCFDERLVGLLRMMSNKEQIQGLETYVNQSQHFPDKVILLNSTLNGVMCLYSR